MATEMKNTIKMDIGGGVSLTFEFTRFVESEDEVREAADNDKHLVDAYIEGYGNAS